MAPRRRASTPPPQVEPSAGAKLIAAMTRKGDPVEVTLLIEEAGQVKDFIDSMRPLLNGDPQAWRDVKIGAKTVEVVVTNPLIQYRQLTEQLRKLIATITTIQGQRGAAGNPNAVPDPTAV